MAMVTMMTMNTVNREIHTPQEGTARRLSTVGDVSSAHVCSMVRSIRILMQWIHHIVFMVIVE